MADIRVVAGEFGFDIEILIHDSNKNILDISEFTTSKLLDVKPSDYGTAVLTNKALTFKTDGTDGILIWKILSGDWPATGATAGDVYYGQVHLESGSKKRLTEQVDIFVERAIG